MVTIKVEGLKELRHALLQLPKELHKNALRAAVSAGAKVVQDQAKLNVRSKSYDTGTLMRAIYRTRSRSNSSAVQEAQIVGVRSGKRYQSKQKKGGGNTASKDAWYWRFVEFGVPVNNMPAEPFLRPAFNTTIPQQIEAIRSRLATAIQKAAEKLRKK